ncbi:RNA helicase [Angomonas deanei]|uniref:RNA helicase n=1 Tax=Angomonas deanei TaxID=59799 RepID=A0A7G2C697_9TRYP|nr:RNA helicase [Angomonas deanei]CAD2214634.1 Helicase conserved C-terminal domain/Mitochondrial degradasome RNA helicase subunit C terminal, putative [Angomonas deanei]|eukprot:EPY40701.1 RNA helicase [Angomonas deanei]
MWRLFRRSGAHVSWDAVRYLNQSALKDALQVACGVLYRSSTAREALCEGVHQPSPETTLLLLDQFKTEEGVWRRKDWVERFEAAHRSQNEVEKMQLVTERFRQWFYAREAQRMVHMDRPHDWYPLARYTRRRFYFHCGPTNSGKTHTAIETLIAARSGVYCAPLKALAGQVWQTINARGTPCDLMIGDERRFAGGAEHVSCTVEMTPVDAQVDVAVIDEVQMIGDTERGWAWTRALLGLPAREIHLCGEARAIPLIKKLLYSTFELKHLEIVPHDRLVPLTITPCLNGDLKQVENGDCLVCFSYKNVLHFKRTLNNLLGAHRVKVSYIYGGMPFEVRQFQMTQFNTGVQDYIGGKSSTQHVLVATDAVAYGLNMNVERIIFTTTKKFTFAQQPDGSSAGGYQPLAAPLVQQISGRAGRHGLTRRYDCGRCTTLRAEDYAHFASCMKEELQPIPAAGLLPTLNILLIQVELCLIDWQKQNGQKRVTISDVENLNASGKQCYEWVSQFFASESTRNKQNAEQEGGKGKDQPYFLCDASRSVLKILSALQDNDALTLKDRILFSFLPLNDNSNDALQLLQAYAADHASGVPVSLRIDKEFANYLQTARGIDIRVVERYFKRAEMYNWLSWRFKSTFIFRDDAEQLKKPVLRNGSDFRNNFV